MKAVLVFVMLCVGCAGSFDTTASVPTKSEFNSAWSRFHAIQPGMPASAISDRFEAVTRKTVGKYGVVDVETFNATGFYQKTYWIGYFYDNGITVEEGKRLGAITTLNGKVDSVFKP